MKNKFKKSKIIVPALALITATTVASVTGTVAWFTANKAVSVSGMAFKAQASSNLLIADDNNGTTTVVESNFSSSLTQNINKNLMPASTVNALDFAKTTSAKADGSKETSATYEGVTNPTTEGSNDAYYIDYSFQLKAINTGTAQQQIYVSDLDLKYTSAYATGDLATAVKAFRVAFFIEGTTTSSDGTTSKNFLTASAAVSGNMKEIFTPRGAENQTSNKAVSKTTVTDGSATYSLGDVTYITTTSDTTALTLATVSNGTSYYKGVARVWLEGEDKNCTNDLFKAASENWSFTMKLSLGDISSPDATNPVVKNIKVATGA